MPKSIDAQTYNIRQVQDAMRETGALIEAVRKERGWSQSELGRRLGGIDRRHVSAMEKGDASTDFGLVVSALWVLDIPVLETLRAERTAPPSTVLGSTGVDKPSRYGPGHKPTGRLRKKLINNDF